VWIYCPYVPVSEDLTLESSWLFQLLERSVMWRTKPSVAKSWRTRWKRGGWIRHLCGHILGPSMANRGVEQWISSLVDTRVNHSQVLLEDSMSRRISGPNLKESLVRSNHDTCSLKMYGTHWTHSVWHDLTSKQWATACHRLLKLPPPAWVPHTSGHVYSYLPTPTCIANQSAPSMQKHPSCRLAKKLGVSYQNPLWAEYAMGYQIGWTDLEL